MKRKIIICICAVLLLNVGWFAYCGYQWSWGMFHKLHDIKTYNLAGNDSMYDIDNDEIQISSPLAGKTIVFLGSSVTYGAASTGVAFPEYISYRNNCNAVKEAVSGTTLVDDKSDSYISRLEKLDYSGQVDLFVCQLSTNDASQNKPLGSISEDNNFDTHTVAGAIEHIISYAEDKWNCPVVFYTNCYYENENYEQMVELIHEIADKWDITVIDMYNDTTFNAISDEDRNLYMADSIHPTKAGYKLWWTPYMETKLYELMDN